jgi:hypothetical protein
MTPVRAAERRDAETLAAILSFGCMPTYAELAEQLGLRSRSSAYDRVRLLARSADFSPEISKRLELFAKQHNMTEDVVRCLAEHVRLFGSRETPNPSANRSAQSTGSLGPKEPSRGGGPPAAVSSDAGLTVRPTAPPDVCFTASVEGGSATALPPPIPVPPNPRDFLRKVRARMAASPSLYDATWRAHQRLNLDPPEYL